MKARIVDDVSVSARKVLVVPIHTIKPTPYNPERRTKEGKALQKLIDAIRKHGIVYPILITEDRELADGNRRLAAAKACGLTHIECIVSDVPRDELFNTVNETPMAMKSAGWLEIARGGRKIPEPYASQYRELLATIGSYGVDTMLAAGLGMNSLAMCKNVASLDGSFKVPDLLIKCAQRKLTNKFNAVLRMESDRAAKVEAIMALIA